MRNLVLLTVLLGCSALSQPTPANAQGKRAQDEAAIHRLIADYTAAWSPWNPQAYAAVHVPDAIAIDLGVLLKGRSAIVNKAQTDLTGEFKGLQFTSHKVETIRFLNRTTAIGTSTWEASMPNQPNLKGVALFVVSKQGARWLLEAWHAAATQP